MLFINFSREINIIKRAGISWLITSSMGLIDEVNQYFIAGRDGRLLDVILNSSAAFAVILLLLTKNLINLKQTNTKIHVSSNVKNTN